MKIAILDDYQDVVRQLRCFDLLKEHDVKVFSTAPAVRGSWQSGWRRLMPLS
jgi:D-3-phosphoglycerate dehydrogenase